MLENIGRTGFGLPAALALLVGLCLPAANALAQDPALVRIDKVRSEPLIQTVPVIGRIVSRRTGDIAARIGGRVEEVRVEVGDRIKQDDVIAILDDRAARADQVLAESELAEAEADLASSKAEAELARIELARQDRLKSSTAFSQARFEDAQLKLSVAEAKTKKAQAVIASKKAALARKNLDVEFTVVKAPFGGVVLQRMAEVGAYISTGDALVKLIGDRSLEIEADIPYRRLSGLTTGRKIDITLDDGSHHKAAVRALLPEENSLTRTRTALLVPDFSTITKSLAQGQSVTVEVPVGEQRKILTIHKDAILKRPGGDQVYVVVDGKAEARDVKLGEGIGGRIEVIDGVKENDPVVVRGNERLQPGAPVAMEKGAS